MWCSRGPRIEAQRPARKSSQPVKRRTIIINERITKNTTDDSSRQRPRSPSPVPLSHRLNRITSLPSRNRTERRATEMDGHVPLPPPLATKERLNSGVQIRSRPVYEDRSPADYGSTRNFEARGSHQRQEVRTSQIKTGRSTAYKRADQRLVDEYITSVNGRHTLKHDSITPDDRVPRGVQAENPRNITVAVRNRELERRIQQLESANQELVERLQEQTRRARDAQCKLDKYDELFHDLEQQQRLAKSRSTRVEYGARLPSRERPRPNRPVNSSMGTNPAMPTTRIDLETDRENAGGRNHAHLSGDPHVQTARSSNIERRHTTSRGHRYK